MSRSTKVALVALLVVALSGATAAWATVKVVNAGSVGVSVTSLDPGTPSISLRAPAILLTAAASFVPLTVLPEEAARELRPMLPAARELTRGLQDLPDAVFVEVVDHGERVVVAKRGQQLVVLVDTPRENVSIEVPLRAADILLARLSDAVDAR